MSNEQILLDKWQALDEKKQAQVLAFIESLNSERSSLKAVSLLGQKLRTIRQEIVDSGIPLLSENELEAEIQARRGGYRSNIND